MSGARGPRPLAAAFAALTDELSPQTLLGDVQRVWASTVGEAISQSALPTAERGGVITVSCEASVWAQELDLMGPHLVASLNARLGGDAVRRLRCVAVGHGR